MVNIGNADRVALMQRLVALQVEHRDLDAVIQHLVLDPKRANDPDLIAQYQADLEQKATRA